MVSHTETAPPQAMPVVRLWWLLAIVLASLCVALLLLTGWREWTLGQLGAHSFPGSRSTPPTGSFLAFTAGLAVLAVGVAASARRHPRKWRRRVLLGMALLILASAGVVVAGTRAAGEARTCHRSAVTTVTAFATGLGLECMRMMHDVTARVEVEAKIAGPANIGNYLAGLGIPATAGFGVTYTGLHGTDERIRLDTIPTVQAIYHHAVQDLLNLTR